MQEVIAVPQYTIRNVPDVVDRELRELARGRGLSLNQAAIDAIGRGLGVSAQASQYHDLDDLIGTWKQEEAFDQAIEEQDEVELDQWR